MPKPIATLVFIELLTATHYCNLNNIKALGQVNSNEFKLKQISLQQQQRHRRLVQQLAAKPVS
jgi:hypothetical protein